jgi:hypothetical protein
MRLRSANGFVKKSNALRIKRNRATVSLLPIGLILAILVVMRTSMRAMAFNFSTMQPAMKFWAGSRQLQDEDLHKQ